MKGVMSWAMTLLHLFWNLCYPAFNNSYIFILYFKRANVITNIFKNVQSSRNLWHNWRCLMCLICLLVCMAMSDEVTGRKESANMTERSLILLFAAHLTALVKQTRLPWSHVFFFQTPHTFRKGFFLKQKIYIYIYLECTIVFYKMNISFNS